MTGRPLTDAQLTAALRAHLPAAGTDLDARIRAAILTTPQQRRLPSVLGRLTDADPIARRRATLMVALIALALAISAVAGAGAVLRDDGAPDLSVVPPTETTPLPTLGPDVRGWPGTAQNPPGEYSWGGGCAQAFCVFGFMHNGYGSGDVEFRFPAGARTAVGDDWTATTVVGAQAWHRQLDDGVEEWLVQVGQTAVTIRMTARPGTSEADLAEARAIVASMRAVASGDRRGFRLVFTLATDDWDSG